MGLYEDLLDRIRPVAESAGFSAAPPASERDPWDLPRLTDLPETMLPPHLRKKSLPAVDASSIGIQSALGNQPITTPGLPAAFQTAGMLPSLNPNDPVGLTDAEKAAQALAGGGAAGAPVPMPQARPTDAPATPLPEPASMAPAPGLPAPPSATDFSSQSRAPLQIAPQAASLAPAIGMVDTRGPSMFDRIRSTLGDNSNTLLAIGAGLAGAPNWGQGISRAASAAIPARAADISQTLAAQSRGYGTKALVDAGVPVQQAIAAAGDPDLKKALIQNYIVDRKHELKTVKDWMGNESLVDFDPFTSKTKAVTLDGSTTPGAPSGGIMAAAKMEPSYDPTTNRDESFLDAVRKADPLSAAAVKDIADGKMPASGRNLQKLMPLAARYEQGFEANRFAARQNLEKSYYGGGEGGKALRSANTTVDHGIDLKKAIDDLHNFSVLPGYLNPLTGKLAENMGDKRYQDALARFRSNATIYSKELENALTGKVTVSGQKELHGMFDEYGSPTANQSALQQTLGMLEKRVNEHENTYNTGMNKPNHTFNNDMLSNRKKLDALLAGDTGSGLKTQQPNNTVPPPGKYMWDATTGKMVPLQ